MYFQAGRRNYYQNIEKGKDDQIDYMLRGQLHGVSRDPCLSTVDIACQGTQVVPHHWHRNTLRQRLDHRILHGGAVLNSLLLIRGRGYQNEVHFGWPRQSRRRYPGSAV